MYSLYGLDKTYQLVPVVSSPELVALQPTPSKRLRLHEKTPPRRVDELSPLQDERDHLPDDQCVLHTGPHTDFVNKSSLEFVRTYSDGKTESVPLTKGPDGFVVAVLKTETVTTEVPSLALLPAAPPIKKRPAGKKCMKKQRKKQKVVFVHMYMYFLTYFLTLYVRLFIEFPSRA